MIVKVAMTIKCDSPVCDDGNGHRVTEEFVHDGPLRTIGKDDDDDRGWLFSEMQDLCPACLKIQQAMLGKSKYNYIKYAPKAEVEKYIIKE